MTDVAMSLGNGWNTNASGLGDNKHPSPGIPESSLPSSFAPLPPTASSVTVDMLDALDNIEQGRSSSLSDSSSSSVEDIPTRRFHFEGAAIYDNFGSVARAVQALGDGHNKLLDVISRMANHVIGLERLCQRLERRVNKLEDADDVLALGKPVFTPSPPADESPVRNRRQRRRRARKGFSDDAPAFAAAASRSGPAPPPSAQTACNGIYYYRYYSLL